MIMEQLGGVRILTATKLRGAMLTLLCSSPHTKVLFLHLHRLRRPPHNQCLHNTACHTLCPRIESLPPAHTTILPICPHRTPPRWSSPRCTRYIWNRATAMEKETGSEEIWCGDTNRQAHNSMATTEWDECVGLRFGTFC